MKVIQIDTGHDNVSYEFHTVAVAYVKVIQIDTGYDKVSYDMC